MAGESFGRKRLSEIRRAEEEEEVGGLVSIRLSAAG